VGIVATEARSFNELVQQGLAAFERGELDQAIALCDRVAERAPRELIQLAALPSTEGLTLWMRFTARASASMTELFVRYRRARAENDPLEMRWVAKRGERLQRAVTRVMQQPIKRAVPKPMKEWP
jgi:hypothetical protein